MKIKIKSKYDYGTHAEEMNEELECVVAVKEDGGVVMTHDAGSILIEENRMTQLRNGNTMIIETGKTTVCQYQTEVGALELQIEGVLVERGEAGRPWGRAVYLISAKGVEPYRVEIEIM